MDMDWRLIICCAFMQMCRVSPGRLELEWISFTLQTIAQLSNLIPRRFN